MIPKVVIEFKIYPNGVGTEDYFVVSVYETSEQMVSEAVELHGDPEPFTARCTRFVKIDPATWTRRPQVGHLFFYRDVFGAGIVAHEATHAAIGYLTLLNDSGVAFDLGHSDEERFCEIVESLVSQIWAGYYRNESFFKESRPVYCERFGVDVEIKARNDGDRLPV